MRSDREFVHNRLLLALPGATLERLWPALLQVNLERGQPIGRVNGPIEHVYFVDRGLVSVVKTMSDGRSVEVGAVGVEGVTHANSLFGSGAAVLEAVVQLPARAFRIEREALRREMQADETLNQLIQNYGRFAYAQLAQTSACNGLHSLEERCCRWLLTAADSALSDSFPLTHEQLAMMLGVQRSGVSIAARILKKAQLIDYSRGEVTILDRAGLEEAACECYASLKEQLEELFAPTPAPARRA
jgi:CRP-like cAMP-binding protein